MTYPTCLVNVQPKHKGNELFEIIAGTTKLIQEALAVKAILYTMPAKVEPTEKDIKVLVKIFLDRNLNIILSPYSDVHKMLCEYYKL